MRAVSRVTTGARAGPGTIATLVRRALQCQISWHHRTFDNSSMMAKAIPNTKVPVLAAPNCGRRSKGS
ncbi:hypothetical protein [Streptomyces sviceus]|uniref:hypothetical protein n=1 Tax=Streptomyces sviceus TaxID=285530 RepID=UPI0036BCDF5C